jgi:hypothetical protein
MVTINQGFQIENVSQMIKYLLGIYKNNEIKFKPSHGTPYYVIRYRQNTNHYNKIFDNPVVDNQYQSINANLFFIGGLFMLKPFKIQTGNSSDLRNIHFEILDIDGVPIKFLSTFHIRMKFTE